MDMSLTNCWDCPTPLLFLLAQYGFAGLLLVGGAWAHRSRRYAVQGLGAVTVVLVGFWLVVLTFVAPRWGVLVSESPLVILDEGRSRAIMVGLDLVIASVAGYTSWSRRRAPESGPVVE